MAVLLSLCLILNSGFLDLAGYVYAATADFAPNSTVQTTDVISNDNNTTGTDTINADTPLEPANDGSDLNDGDSTNTTENGGNNGTTSTTSTDSSEDSNDDEDEQGGNSDTDGINETVPETTPETETTTEETTTEEITTEEETTEKAPVMMSARAVEESVPSDIDTYLAQVAAGKNEFYIKTTQDFINVQELCKDSRVDGFAGITFKISYPEDVADSSQQHWDTSQMTGFTGIGSSAAPFKGTMESAFDDYDKPNPSTHLKLDRPLFSRLGDGATFRKMKIVANGCSSPIAEYVDHGNITLSDLAISGTIGKGAATYEAGTIAAIILPNAKITISNVSSTANVTAGYAGAIAGRCYSTANITWPDGYVIGSSSASITVTGTNGAGGLYGYAAATHTIDLKYFDHISVNVNGNNGYAGQLIGYLDGTQYATNVTIVGGNSITAKVGTTSGTTAGGLIGIAVKATLTLPEGEFTVNGKVDGGTHVAGGLIGVVTYSNMIIENVTIAENAEINANLVGGIIGRFGAASALETVDKSRMIIDTPTVNGKLTATGGIGGILGWVDIGCAVELQGTVTVADNMSGTDAIGSVVAKQDSALIYLHGIEGKNTDGASQLDVPLAASSLPKYNDVYTYGGVFRNQDMSHKGTGVLLIGDGTLANVGVVNNSITGGKLGESGTIDAAADLETFAIANFSNGEFGLTGVFTDASSTADILSGDYVLYNNADISYEKTGIITLNRNDVEDNGANIKYAFSGKLAGVNENITITQDTYLFQWRMGLFSGLAGTPEFSNLIIQGDVTRSSYVGGLAYWISGDGIKLTNVQMYKDFSSVSAAVGGFIVREIGSSLFTVEADNVVLASKINAGSISDCSGFINNMDYATVNMKDITFGGGLKSSGSGTFGGFFGKSWTHIGGTITDVTVQSGTNYDTNAVCGALIHTASSKAEGSILTMDNVNLVNLNVTLYNQGDSSLGIHNGQRLVLEMIDYNTQGVTVAGAATDFDEIMAYNVLEPSQKTFGVVSLHKRRSKFPTYHYENQATYTSSAPTINDTSRYYYDVFQNLEPDAIDSWATEQVVVSGNVIDSPAKYFVWHILQCCHGEAELRNTFKPYFEGGNLPSNSNEIYTFSGDLNLSTYSIYPVPRQQLNNYNGVNNAKFTFAAEDMAGWKLSNVEKSQHNMLHSGLFYSTYNSGPIIVDNITLAGSIACVEAYSCGALVAGALNSGGKFTNITLDNLHIHDYNGSGASLLIGNIPDSTVIFDGIEMKNYKAADYADTKAAGSLIYAAGGDDATDLVLKFHDMVIIDDRQADKEGTVLKYSSFIYKYDYTDNASINEGSGLYLFSEADEAARRVTYGAELDDDTEYSDTENKVLDPSNAILIQDMGQVPANPAVAWIPYIWKEKQIEVNPKSGDVLKGCGTYEDPYIIETTKQFLTLYRYINEPEKAENEDYQYQSFYENWKMIKMGNDSTFCSTKHEAMVATDATPEEDIVRVSENGLYKFTGTGAEDVRVFGEEGFPTPDQLSQAYYQLGEDLNLSGITNSTYSQIADDFVGFGTLERPFTGVWYGRDDEDSTVIHTITLPDKESTAIYTTYGFIQYAQGAVIKDLIIESPYNEEGTERLQTQINGTWESAGGSVIACVIGGDNIIDGVTSKVHFLNTNGNASVGGYVGVVKKGGLILRKMTDSSLSEYKLTLSSVGDWNRGLYGAVAGKVEDGYIIYEGATGDSYLYDGNGGSTLTYDSYGGSSSYGQVGNYQIVNGDKLKADCAGFVITISDTEGGTAEKDIDITIPNAAGLQVMSMAMNANAFNVMPSDDTAYASGYTEISRSRKAAYDKIGNCESAEEADYVKAAAYDNANGYTNRDYNADKAYAYPYLFQYMGIDGTKYLDYIDGEYSVLNTWDSVNGTTYHMYWNLIKNDRYDMRVFNAGEYDSFRGIGGLYYPANAVGDTITNIAGSTFRGDFDGNGSTILIDMERSWIVAEDWQGATANVRKAGLFNVFYAPMGDPETKGIYNHREDLGNTDGTVLKRPCFKISDFALGGSIEVKPAANAGNKIIAGGVVAEVATGNYIFDNISIAESVPLTIGKTTAAKMNSTGGIAGRIGTNWNQTTSCVLIQNCNWISTGMDILVNGYSYTGGFVGETTARVLQIKDSSIDNISVISGDRLDTGVYAGGFVGYVNASAGILLINGTTEDETFIKNAVVAGWEKAGGMVGESTVGVEIQNVLSENNTIFAYNQIGGVLGHLSGEKISNLYHVNVKDILTNEINRYNGQSAGIGGVVGKNEHTLLIEGANVTGTKTDDTYNCRIQGIRKNRTGDSGVGGIVGIHTSKPLTLRECKVSNIYLKADGKFFKENEKIVHQPALMAGGLVGCAQSEVMLDGAIKTSKLSVNTPQQTKLAESAVEGFSDNYNLVGAGGCFGRIKGCVVGGYRTFNTTTYYKGLETENNVIQGKNAGGICGYVDSGEIRLHGVKVTGGDIYGDSTAGGIFGYVIPHTNGIALNNLKTYESTALVDQNVVSGVKITGSLAGGAIGHANITAARMRIENITIIDCEIHARKLIAWSKDSVGGLVGMLSFSPDKEMVVYGVTIEGNTIVCENEGNTIAKGKIIYPAAGGLVGRSDSTKAGRFFCDLLTIKENNQIGFIDSTADTPTVKLVQYNETDDVFELVNPVLPENIVMGDLAIEGTEWKNYNAVDALVQKYGYCVGSIIGVADSEVVDFYIWRSKDENNLFNNPVMSSNPPVTDVGFNEIAEITESDAKYWRNQVHIVYGAPVDVGEGVIYESSDPAGNLAYMKMRVDEADTAYDKAASSFESLLTSYRLSQEDVELFKVSYQESYAFPGTEYMISEPLLVLKTENGTVQESMERITNIMTNMAGNSATDIAGSVLTIDTKQLVVKEDGTIVEGAGTPSITASITDGVVTYESADYDIVTGEGLTFTELTFTYEMPDVPGHPKTFKLRILVEEPILYGVHMKILEDNVTSVSDIMQNGLLASDDGTRVVIANDSDYTLLMEYTYGKAREKMPAEVAAEKSFILKASEGVKELPVGTKLRLIDVTHGNVPYYYTVESTGIMEVKFSDFKDSAGKPYVNQPIRTLPSEGEEAENDPDTIVYTDLAGHTLTNTGVERYLLTVFNAETDNMAYQIHTDMVPQILKDGIEDTEASKNAKTQFSPFEEHEKMPWFFVTAVPGLKISLVKTDNQTDIDGKITKEDSLIVKATILLDGDNMYWAFMDQDGLDSENNGKFLDIALYLRDGGRVNLPEGTNISYVIGVDGEGNKIYSENKVIQDNTVLYYYKDIEEIEKSIDEILAGANKQDVTIDVEFVLNFAGADLSEFTSGSYEACIELLRTADSKYPMGSGNTLDIYSETVQVQAANNLGFAIKSKQLEQLAINTYPAANADGNIIDYQTMFDFSDILEKISGAGEAEALERWAGFDYEVTYELWKKTENGENVTYERYTGNDIVIKVTDADGDKVSTSGAMIATYRFETDEIKEGTTVDGKQQEGLIIRDGQMAIATADLVSASQDNLTNYKIIATMKIKDNSASGGEESINADSELATEDFFVFTVTKLKTDLSE